MSRLLSQGEVDALLASFEPSGAEGALAVELPFDLRAPLILVGERLALVQSACERIADVLAAQTDAVLAPEHPARASFFGLIQQPAATLLATLAPGEVIGLLLDEQDEPLGGLSIPAELAVALADRLLGGEGRPPDVARPLSPVETDLLGAFVERFARRMSAQDGFGTLRAGGVECDPSDGALARRGGALATAQLRLVSPAGEVVCRFLMTPALTNRIVAGAPIHGIAETPAALRAAVERISVTVEPVLSGKAMRLADVAQLAPGDVVEVDFADGELLGVRLNGALFARGVMRGAGRQRTIEIAELTAPGCEQAPGAEEEP